MFRSGPETFTGRTKAMAAGGRASRSAKIPLDTLVRRLGDRTFTSRYRRRLSLRQTSSHVNPVMLAASASDSLYVRAWRDHATSCPACAKLFAYFELEL